MSVIQEELGAKCMVGILLLDIKNAFNSAPWGVIVETLRSKRIPGYISRILDDYFNGRKLIYEVGGSSVTRELPQGCHRTRF